MLVLRNKNYSIISRGIRFVKEIKTIDPLPMSIEDYAVFLFHIPKVKSIFPKTDLQESKQKSLSSMIDKFYGLPEASMILRKIGIGFFYSALDKTKKLPESLIYGRNKVFDQAVEYSWSKVNHIPKRWLFSSIGVGCTGVAFNYSKGKIEKISFNGFNKDELKFYDYLEKHPLSIFPKIYDYESDQVIMEKLILDTPKVNRYKDWIHKYIYKPDPKGVKKEVRWDELYKDLGKNHEFVLFLSRVIEGMDKIFGTSGNIGDLTRNNIGEREKTGEIVYFDPIIP